MTSPTTASPSSHHVHRPPWAIPCFGWFLLGLAAAPWVVEARTYRALIGRSLPVSLALGAAGLGLLVWGMRRFLRKLSLRRDGDLVSLYEGEVAVGLAPRSALVEFRFHPANLARLALLAFVAYLGIDGVLHGRSSPRDRVFEAVALLLPLLLALLSEIVKRTLRREFWVPRFQGGTEALYVSRADARELLGEP